MPTFPLIFWQFWSYMAKWLLPLVQVLYNILRHSFEVIQSTFSTLFSCLLAFSYCTLSGFVRDNNGMIRQLQLLLSTLNTKARQKLSWKVCCHKSSAEALEACKAGRPLKKVMPLESNFLLSDRYFCNCGWWGSRIKSYLCRKQGIIFPDSWNLLRLKCKVRKSF